MTPTIYNPVSYTTSYRTPSNIDQTNDATETSSIGRKKRGVAHTAALWPQNSTVRISFIGMTKEEERFTKENINKWAPHVNLKFEFTDKPDGDIRIAVDIKSIEGWSEIGTEAKMAALDEPTMVIGFAGGEGTDTAALIQHEFGHALGLKHEHQHPDSGLDFNHEKVYYYYEDKETSRKVIHDNILKKHDRKDVITSDYDPQSIMHYSFRQSLFNSGKGGKKNLNLSAGDISFARSLYPPKSENHASPFNPNRRPHPLQNPLNPSIS